MVTSNCPYSSDTCRPLRSDCGSCTRGNRCVERPRHTSLLPKGTWPLSGATGWAPRIAHHRHLEVRRRLRLRAGDRSAERVRVIHYGVDPSNWVGSKNERTEHRQALRLAPDDIAVGVASRLVPGKGHDVALRAFAAVAERQPRIRLLVAGDGPLRGKSKRWHVAASPRTKQAFWASSKISGAFLTPVTWCCFHHSHLSGRVRSRCARGNRRECP